MKSIIILSLSLSLLCVQAAHLPQRRDANPQPAPQAMDEHIFELTSAERAGAAAAASSTAKPLGIVSIKTRAVAMDRGLCLERSRYHPHFPKCHLYCKHLDHWIGQCRRESCHCIS